MEKVQIRYKIGDIATGFEVKGHSHPVKHQTGIIRSLIEGLICKYLILSYDRKRNRIYAREQG